MPLLMSTMAIVERKYVRRSKPRNKKQHVEFNESFHEALGVGCM